MNSSIMGTSIYCQVLITLYANIFLVPPAVCLILARQLWAESVINVLSGVTRAKFRAFRLFVFSAGIIFWVFANSL